MSRPPAAVEQNPLVEGLERLPVHPTTLVIFGGTGDLAKRKLLPAIYNLAHEGALPERFNLIAVSRSDMPARRLPGRWRASRSSSSRAASPTRRCSTRLLENVRYVPGTFDDDSMYERLKELPRRSSTRTPGIAFNRVFYLSTAPAFFPVIVGKLGEHGLDEHEESEVRVVIEKPIGTNLAEARELNTAVLERAATRTRSSGSTTTSARRPSRT